MKNKQGITLIILVITIILIIILVGTLSVSVGNSVGNSRISAFASDLKEVEDATKTYYMLKNEFPSIDDKIYTQGEIASIVPTRYKSKFLEELQLNNDDVLEDTEGTFYLIDLAKIDIEQTTRGTRIDEDGNIYESDVFAIVYPSMNVYYLEGLRANNDVFFSLSSKITKLTKIVKEETVESGTTSLTTSDGIIVKKETDKWTNSLNVVVESYMDYDESLYIQMGDSSRHLLTTVLGNNTLQLKNNFMSVYSNTTNQEYETGITEAEMNTFNNLSQSSKKMIITKERGGQVIGKVIVNLSNYEKDLPALTSQINVEHQPTYNYIYFNVTDTTSGVKQVKYEYLTRIDENGDSVSYFENVDSYDDNYMKNRAKKATVSSTGLVEIQVPKDIEIIQINVFDKAGNSSAKINQRIISDTYLGVNAIEATTTSLKLNAVAKVPSGKDINSATIKLSTDGINYSNDKDVSFVSNSNGAYTASVNYVNLSELPNKVYVQITLNYGDNEEITTIKEVDIDSILIDYSNVSAQTVANNPTEFYGDEVNYTTGNDTIDSQVEWQIFYADTSNIYLIATDYVHYDLLPTKKVTEEDGTETVYALNKSSDYKAYFTTMLPAYNGSEDITEEKIQALNSSYHEYLTTNNTVSENDNMKAVAYMLDTSETVWGTFAGEDADYAIGGPTVEMLMKSYNQKYSANYVDYRAKVTSINGYQISKDGGINWADYYSGMLDVSDTQYVINASDKKANGMWLASPSANYTSIVMRAYCDGYVSGSNVFNVSNLGFRPIVCLSSNVSLEAVNGEYYIQ